MAAEEGNLIACQHGQAALAARLLKRVSAGRTSSNLIFSPLSIHVALALMSAGAAEDTLDEILSIAGAPSRGDLEAFVKGVVVEHVLADRSGIGGPSVAFACGSWTDKTLPLKPTYRDTVVGTYKGETWAVDFRNHVRVHIPHPLFCWFSRKYIYSSNFLLLSNTTIQIEK
jgi:serpin B